MLQGFLTFLRPICSQIFKALYHAPFASPPRNGSKAWCLRLYILSHLSLNVKSYFCVSVFFWYFLCCARGFLRLAQGSFQNSTSLTGAWFAVDGSIGLVRVLPRRIGGSRFCKMLCLGTKTPPPRRFYRLLALLLNQLLIALQRRKRHKLLCSVLVPHISLCPPIIWFRSLMVAHSSKLMPLKMAFLP